MVQVRSSCEIYKIEIISPIENVGVVVESSRDERFARIFCPLCDTVELHPIIAEIANILGAQGADVTVIDIELERVKEGMPENGGVIDLEEAQVFLRFATDSKAYVEAASKGL